MNNIVGLAVFALGIVFLIFGLDAVQATNSEASRLFAGIPANGTAWLLIGGAAFTLSGLAVAIRGLRRH